VQGLKLPPQALLLGLKQLPQVDPVLVVREFKQRCKAQCSLPQVLARPTLRVVGSWVRSLQHRQCLMRLANPLRLLPLLVLARFNCRPALRLNPVIQLRDKAQRGLISSLRLPKKTRL
jgi:hypothetical protein